MDIEAEILLQADDELVAQMRRLEAVGVTLREMASGSEQTRTLMLVDRNGHVVLTCLVRLEPIEQVREMLNFYERAILDPQATRH